VRIDINKTGDARIHETLKRDLVTIAAMEKRKDLYILSVCL